MFSFRIVIWPFLDAKLVPFSVSDHSLKACVLSRHTSLCLGTIRICLWSENERRYNKDPEMFKLYLYLLLSGSLLDALVT